MALPAAGCSGRNQAFRRPSLRTALPPRLGGVLIWPIFAGFIVEIGVSIHSNVKFSLDIFRFDSIVPRLHLDMALCWQLLRCGVAALVGLVVFACAPVEGSLIRCAERLDAQGEWDVDAGLDSPVAGPSCPRTLPTPERPGPNDRRELDLPSIPLSWDGGGQFSVVAGAPAIDRTDFFAWEETKLSVWWNQQTTSNLRESPPRKLLKIPIGAGSVC